jgi:hypothetical protein
MTLLVPVELDASMAPEFQLVRSSSKRPYEPDYPELRIGEDAIWVNGAPVVELTDGAAPGDAGELLIEPLRDALAELPENERVTEGPPTITIIPSARTSYRLFTRVLYTVGIAGLLRYQFPVTDEAGRKHAIMVEAPRADSVVPRRSLGNAGAAAPLNLSVMIDVDGLRLSSARDSLPGASAETRELLIPLRDDWQRLCSAEELALRTERGLAVPPARAYDHEALRGRLLGVQGRHGEERRIILRAAENVDWEAVVSVMDTAREANGSPLFPDVVFAVGR